MAVGMRPRPPALEQVVLGRGRGAPLSLLICPEIANTENLGGLIRIAACFGANAVVLGERSCDPFFRQSVRVSMGTVFSLPIVRSDDIVRDLRWLGSREADLELIASVLDDRAQELSSINRPPRFALLVGNEAQGLVPEHVALCNRCATIPMSLGADSLNVMVATGILLYHLTRRAD
jgi:tRNA G18 (ribose-2'-O)-methylase SpoU